MSANELLVNLWGNLHQSKIRCDWCDVGFFTLSDLPLVDGKIDFNLMANRLCATCSDTYLLCCKFQRQWGMFLPLCASPFNQNFEILVQKSKQLLLTHSVCDQSLQSWEHILEIMPLDPDESKKVFKDMLVRCKVTKFLEINYKILTRILVTPAVLGAIHRDSSLANCSYCGERVNIDHILFFCPLTVELHQFIMVHMGLANPITWIFGGAGHHWDPVIWVTNFAIYKVHLMCSHGKFKTLKTCFSMSVISLSLYVQPLIVFVGLMEITLLILFQMDDWMDIPLDLGAVQQLLDDIAPKWCAVNLPATSVEPVPTLVTALCYALSMDKDQLRLKVKYMFLEPNQRVAAASEI